MQRNVIETIMGGVVILVAVTFVFFVFQSSGVKSSTGYEVTARFDNASGLTAGTDVRMAGVKIGTVASQVLDPETYFATVTMTIDDAIKLPKDTSARIIPDGLLGGNFVALEPGGEDAMIDPGGTIQFAQGAINVVDLLGRFIFSAAETASEQSGN